MSHEPPHESPSHGPSPQESPSYGQPSHVPSSIEPPTGPIPVQRPRSRWPWIAGALVLVAAAAATVVIVLTSGGNDGVRTLVERVTTFGDTGNGVIVVDFAATREHLGLPTDADPLDYIGPASRDENARPFADTAIALPHLTRPYDSPVHQAIDRGQIVALARTVRFGPGSVTVAETGQSFQEIAAQLEESGDWKRDENVLSFTGGNLDAMRGGGYRHIAGGDGLIVMTMDESPDSARRASSESPDSSELADRVAEVMDATNGTGIAMTENTGDLPCLDAWALTDRYDGTAVAVAVTDDPDSVEPAIGDSRLAHDTTVGTPETSDSRVHVSITGIEQNAGSLMARFPEQRVSDVWTCT